MSRFDDDEAAFQRRLMQARRPVATPPGIRDLGVEKAVRTVGEDGLARFKLYRVEFPHKATEPNERWFGAKADAIKFANTKKRELRDWARTPFRGNAITVQSVVTADMGPKAMLLSALNRETWCQASAIRSYTVWPYTVWP